MEIGVTVFCRDFGVCGFELLSVVDDSLGLDEALDGGTSGLLVITDAVRNDVTGIAAGDLDFLT